MSLAVFMFYFFEGTAAAAAVSLIFIRNVFYGALTLIVCLLSLAGIYVLAFAEFVAVTQILVYAGGILVLIIFGVMLTTKMAGKPLVVKHANVFGGLLVAASFLGVLLFFLQQHKFTTKSVAENTPQYTPINKIGIALMTDYVLPFEAGGVLLLVALIGAAVIASKMKSKKV